MIKAEFDRSVTQILEGIEAEIEKILKEYLNREMGESMMDNLRQSVEDVLSRAYYEDSRNYVDFRMEENIDQGTVQFHPNNLYTAILFRGLRPPHGSLIDGVSEWRDGEYYHSMEASFCLLKP